LLQVMSLHEEEENNDMQMALQAALAAGGLTGAYFLRGWFRGGVCRSPARMDGKTVVITGCNVGIGKETARDLSHRGARIIMACRNLEAAAQAAEEIKAETGGELKVVKLDLASLASVRECAAEIKRDEKKLHVLINNAGVMMCPYTKTEDGFEMQMGTNHFGHFLFTNLLLDLLKASAPARVVNVSSRAHQRSEINLSDINWERRPYSRVAAYADSKLANVLFTKALAKRVADTGVDCYALHPGVVRTELGRHIQDMLGAAVMPFLWAGVYFFSKSPREGAQTSIYCSVDESLAGQSGRYYADCAEKDPQPLAKDEALAERLWEISAAAVEL